MLYQLSGFGTLHYIVSKTTNWLLNIVILAAIVVAYLANRTAHYSTGRGCHRLSGRADDRDRLLRGAQTQASAGHL